MSRLNAQLICGKLHQLGVNSLAHFDTPVVYHDTGIITIDKHIGVSEIVRPECIGDAIFDGDHGYTSFLPFVMRIEFFNCLVTLLKISFFFQTFPHLVNSAKPQLLPIRGRIKGIDCSIPVKILFPDQIRSHIDRVGKFFNSLFSYERTLYKAERAKSCSALDVGKVHFPFRPEILHIIRSIAAQ